MVEATAKVGRDRLHRVHFGGGPRVADVDTLRDDGAQQLGTDPERRDQQRVDAPEPGQVQQFGGVERGEFFSFRPLDVPDYQARLRPEEIVQPLQGVRMNAPDGVVSGDGLGEVVADPACQPAIPHEAEVDDVGLQVLLDGGLRLGQDLGSG